MRPLHDKEMRYQESQNFVICDQVGKSFCDFVTGSVIIFVNHKHKNRYGTAPQSLEYGTYSCAHCLIPTIPTERYYLFHLTWRNHRLPSPTRINLEEPVRVVSPTRINLEEPISSGYPAHLGLTWRNPSGWPAQPGLICFSIRLSVSKG